MRVVAPFSFKVVARDPSSAARAGILRTPRGPVATPAFVPVATLGAVRAATPECLEQWGATLLMTNAYHLAMRPGAAVVGRLGGLHALSGWPGPLMTDSGGFQAFRLASLRRIDEDGIRFRSHVDGSPHRFTPESVMELHALLGGDLLMPLDLCTGPGAAPEEAAADAERTVRWAARSLAAPRREDQLLYGIVQGSVYPDLREACAGSLVELGFQAYAVGGVSVGESKQEMRQAVRATVPHLPEESTRHLLGVGEIDDLLESIALGIDTFDGTARP
jgi:queuine tRNA-ribosyltransferase